jgi:hypothetical protein
LGFRARQEGQGAWEGVRGEHDAIADVVGKIPSGRVPATVRWGFGVLRIAGVVDKDNKTGDSVPV